MRRTLIILGALLVAAGLIWPLLARLPFGRLPGDLVIDRPGLRFHFPLATSVIVSLVVSLLLWLLRR